MIKDLTTGQKNILFREETEAPGSSSLNYEKREGDYFFSG
jgi:peptide methionine sulfoxide reductase MsrB